MSDTNNSSIIGGLTATDTNGYLSDDALEDFIQQWFVRLTALSPPLVRPAYQADPPPNPPIGTTWMSFAIERTKMNWDGVVQHYGGTPATETEPAKPGYSVVTKWEGIDITAEFFGPHAQYAGAGVTMGSAISQNQERLGLHGFRFVSATEPKLVSTLFKGKMQRRWELEVSLRRTVQFTYAVLDIASAAGTVSTGDIVSVIPAKTQ